MKNRASITEVDLAMKMKNYEMDMALQALEGLKESGKLGYAIARNKRKLQDAAKEYIDIKNEALQKYGDSKDCGEYTQYSIPLNKTDKVNAYINELGDIPNIEHEVDIFTIPEDEFFSGSLDSDQMEKLLWMVE